MTSQSDSDLLDGARLAVLQDLGSDIVMISYQKFLDHLAPRPPPAFDPNATMKSLRSGINSALKSSNGSDRWRVFPKAPKDSKGSEDKVFRRMQDIFTKVVTAIAAKLGREKDNRTVDFLQNPNRAPTSADRCNESRPDGYLVLKNRKTDGKNVRWADIALSCEYKRKDGVEESNDDVRKCVWSLQHIMRDDPRRRASFGMTIENCTTRVWFCCRSLLVVSHSFNFINEPDKLVKLFAAFAFADQKSLGFDPTIQPYPGDGGQFVITVHPKGDKLNPRRFLTEKILYSHGAEPLRGRGTRVFEAVEIGPNENRIGSSSVVLKDIWIDSDRRREGDILTSLYEEADAKDRPLVRRYFLTTVCDGDVWTEMDILDDTANTLMRGLDMTVSPASSINSPPNSLSNPQGKLTQTYTPKTHYRIVFEEKGRTIDRLNTLPEVMTVLTETVSALQLLRRLGWVHRDVSIGNILSCDGNPKLADLEYAKKVDDPQVHEKRTGTLNFMSIEVAAQEFLFNASSDRTYSTREELSHAIAQRREVAQTTVPFFHNHLHDLESLWWVAVWVVMYNHFSTPEETTSLDAPDRPPFNLTDARRQLELAQNLFPPALNNNSRRDGFQISGSFQRYLDGLPENKKRIYLSLNLLRVALIFDYKVIEADYPRSVDPRAPSNDIYEDFRTAFSLYTDDDFKFALDFIPEIYETLSNPKRPLSESTKEARVAQKSRRK